MEGREEFPENKKSAFFTLCDDDGEDSFRFFQYYVHSRHLCDNCRSNSSSEISPSFPPPDESEQEMLCLLYLSIQHQLLCRFFWR